MSAARTLELDAPYDLRATARPLETGFGDPTRRTLGSGTSVWLWATRSVDGPATLAVEAVAEDRLALRGFGPGAEALLEAAPAALGLDRAPPAEASWPPAIRRLARHARGVRLPRLPGVFEPLVLLILQQKVSGKEAARAYRGLVHAVSEPAPGPPELVAGLWLPPSPEAIRALPSWALPPLGIPARQGETLRRVASQAGRIEAAAALPVAAAIERLRSLPGIGPWTVSSLLLRARGEPDVVPIGDLHLPSLVAFSLAGEARADDARMLELLAPCRGARGWLVRWIEAVGRMPPRRHPRKPLRPLPEGREAALAALRRR